MPNARRAIVSLHYNDKNISADISPYMLSFSFTDNASGKADDFSLELEDRLGNWRGSWFPDKGAKITASVLLENWNREGETVKLPGGTFTIDEISSSGPPEKVSIKGVSVPTAASIKGTTKTRAWENTSLKKIATDIASSGKLTLFFDSKENPDYKRKDQRDEGDLAFLQRLCSEAGLNLKVSDKKIVIFEEQKYESNAPVYTIKRGQSDIKSYSFTSKLQDTANSAEVSYHDPVSNEKVKSEFKPSEPPATGEKLQLNARVESAAEATRVAKNELRNKNKNELTARLSLMGNPSIAAGVTITLQGFGVFDGKYLVDKATHSISNGYSTDVEAHRVLKGY